MNYPFTPQKPLPGAYIPTPGPPTYNGPLFQRPTAPRQAVPALSPPVSAMQTRSALASVPSTKKTESLTPRERAAKTIDETLLQEARYPDLDNYLSQGFSADYDVSSSKPWAPFQKVKMYNIPDQIFEQYNRAQVSTSMGLFAELRHAWVTIDNALYIWDYTHPNPQLVGFEDQPNSITTVKLAKPRPGVFLPTVTHVLVVSTTADIFILGLGGNADGGSKTVSLYQTGMSVSIRGLDINVIASSESGRIFFAGSMDNDVYELYYQQEERWFQGRCSKINQTNKSLSVFAPSFSFRHKPAEYVEQMVVDDSRNLLYTLSSNSAIRVFHMRDDGGLPLTISKEATEIYSNLGHIIMSNETLNPKVKIVSISPISTAEAVRYHLVATTATGYRIYLSATGSSNWSAITSSTSPPTNMQALHVKVPPPDPTASTLSSPTAPTMPGIGYPALGMPGNSMHSLNPTRFAERFPPGYFFCFTSKDPLNRSDVIFISTPDPGRIARPLETAIPVKPTETSIWIKLGSRAEDIGLSSPPTVSDGLVNSGIGNELAMQFDHPTPEIAILTNTGVHVIQRRRLVDVFGSLVRNAGGEDGLESQVKTLIRLYGRSETLATALAVACGQGVELSDTRLSKINDPEVLEFSRKVFIEFGGKPTFNENIDTSTSVIDAVVPSPRHAGIALYISRLLRSIWKRVICKESRSPSAGISISSSVSMAKLQTIQRDLASLHNFFKENKSFIEGLSGPEALSRVATKQEEIALQAEHRAIYSMTQLVSHTIEGISFLLVLFDEPVGEIVSLLPEESKVRFASLTFEELFTSAKGHNVAKELVKAIVNLNIAKGSNVETVADALRRRCGTFCSAEDVIIFKGQELLKRATEAGGDSELGRNLLNDSLALFEKVSSKLPMDYLKSSVDQYIGNHFFAGAIELCLDVAVDSDKANRAYSWIMDGRPPEDQRKASFQFRQQCYELIYKTITAVDELANHDPGFVDGHFTTTGQRKNEAYEVVTNSKDEVFLTSLYDWYLDQGLNDRLLEIKTPFVVTYLERKSLEDISHADLLWRYYGQLGRYHEAAAVQLHLAQSSWNIPLYRRIEYLGQARTAAYVYSPEISRAARQRLLQEITTLIDVGNVQDDLLQRLKEDNRITPERKEAVLEEVGGQILDLSQLYNLFADPGSYHDICLQIMYLANHRNAADIKTTWENLIRETHREAVESNTVRPYEAVAETIRELARKLQLSPTMFPVAVLLPMLERYVLENQLGVGPQNWVVDLFLDLDVPYESLYTVLEAVFYNDEVPFHGRNRRFIGVDLLYVITRWYESTMRIGGGVFGSDVLAGRILETLLMLQQCGLDEDSVQLCRDLGLYIVQAVR